jgi:hypothetical protein
VQSVQRTGSRVEITMPSGARLILDENGRTLAGQLLSPTGNAAQVNMTCVQ